MPLRLPVPPVIDHFWRWLFPSRSVMLELDADVASTVAALQARVVPAGIRNSLRSGMVGRADERSVSVRCRKLLARNSAAPEFAGRFETIDGRIFLVGELRASQSSRNALAGWIGFVVLWWVLAFAVTVGASGPGIPMWMVSVTPGLLIAFAAGITRLSWWLTESDGVQIECLLRDAIAAARGFESRVQVSSASGRV